VRSNVTGEKPKIQRKRRKRQPSSGCEKATQNGDIDMEHRTQVLEQESATDKTIAVTGAEVKPEGGMTILVTMVVRERTRSIEPLTPETSAPCQQNLDQGSYQARIEGILTRQIASRPRGMRNQAVQPDQHRVQSVKLLNRQVLIRLIGETGLWMATGGSHHLPPQGTEFEITPGGT
jgi:hypothetical protein